MPLTGDVIIMKYKISTSFQYYCIRYNPKINWEYAHKFTLPAYERYWG